MARSGHADLPLHYGRVRKWLAQRMSKLGSAIAEAVIIHYGRDEFLKKMSDPFWFQSLGAVMGMDWHSSGITTSVMGALKAGMNHRSGELGVYFCGGRGKHSRQTLSELPGFHLHTEEKTDTPFRYRQKFTTKPSANLKQLSARPAWGTSHGMQPCESFIAYPKPSKTTLFKMRPSLL